MSTNYRRVVTINAGSQVGSREGASWSTNQGFRLAFSVQYKSNSRPNKCLLKMWNLNQASIELLERRGLASVTAGYRGLPNPVTPDDAGSTSVIFTGDISTVNTRRVDRNNHVTEVRVKNEGLNYRDAIFDRSYGSAVSTAKILQDIIREMNIGVGFGVLTTPPIVLPFGATFKGKARKALDRVVEDILGAEWSLQDGQLQILSGDANATKENGFLLNGDTGLLKAQRKKKGVELTCQMTPQIKPGRFLLVASREINGHFVARTVKHNGDGYASGGPFKTIIMARILKGV